MVVDVEEDEDADVEEDDNENTGASKGRGKAVPQMATEVATLAGYGRRAGSSRVCVCVW